MNYIIKPRASRKIFTFYQNVAKKYRHTYDKDDQTDMKFSHDMTPEELYDVIAEEIDHIYADGQYQQMVLCIQH